MVGKKKIVFVAPYPGADRYLDGWMSRIKTIDGVFGDYSRIYIDFQEWYPAERDPELVYGSDLVMAYRVNPRSERHAQLVARVLDEAKFTYIHTLHQCEYMLKYFNPEKMLVDIHGVVPEEELMMGSPERSRIFGEIEKKTISRARWASVVTRSMRDHYMEKYAEAAAVQFIHVPVFDFSALGRSHRIIADIKQQRRGAPVNVAIYAGGAQVWQCVDRMLEVMATAPIDCRYEIYSHDHEAFTKRLEEMRLPLNIVKGYASKEQLEQVYRYSPFGFVLRQASPVNRVASPTKLCDYFANGVIPIVDYTSIGDFEYYGYSYVRHEDFVIGFLPDTQTQEWMIDANVACLEAMYRDFKRGVSAVKDIVDSL